MKTKVAIHYLDISTVYSASHQYIYIIQYLQILKTEIITLPFYIFSIQAYLLQSTSVQNITQWQIETENQFTKCRSRLISSRVDSPQFKVCVYILTGICNQSHACLHKGPSLRFKFIFSQVSSIVFIHHICRHCMSSFF